MICLPLLSSPVMFSIKYSKQFLSYRILKSNRFKYIWRYGLGLLHKGCALGGVCVYCTASDYVPTVLRKAQRVSQQDLESLVSKFNGRIAFYGGASLRKHVNNNDDDNEALDSAPSKIASEANFSRAGNDNFLEKTFVEKKKIELTSNVRVNRQNILIKKLEY